MIHWFDLFVAFFLSASMAYSFFRGFVREIFSLLSMVAGYWFASTYYKVFASVFKSTIEDSTLREIGAFIALFLIAVAGLTVISMVVRKLLSVSKTLGIIDSFAGMSVGFVKGFLILAVLAYPVAVLPGVNKDVIEKAVSAPILVQASHVILEVFAPELAKVVGDEISKDGKPVMTIEKLKKSLKDIGGEVQEKAMSLKESLIDSGGTENKKGDDEKLDKEGMEKLLEKVGIDN